MGNINTVLMDRINRIVEVSEQRGILAALSSMARNGLLVDLDSINLRQVNPDSTLPRDLEHLVSILRNVIETEQQHVLENQESSVPDNQDAMSDKSEKEESPVSDVPEDEESPPVLNVSLKQESSETESEDTSEEEWVNTRDEDSESSSDEEWVNTCDEEWVNTRDEDLENKSDDEAENKSEKKAENKSADESEDDSIEENDEDFFSMLEFMQSAFEAEDGAELDEPAWETCKDLSYRDEEGDVADQDMPDPEAMEEDQTDPSAVWLNSDGSVCAMTSDGLGGHIMFNTAGNSVTGGSMVLKTCGAVFTGTSCKTTEDWVIYNEIPLHNVTTSINGTDISAGTRNNTISVTTEKEHPQRVCVKVQGPYGEKRLCLMAQEGSENRFLEVDEESDEDGEEPMSDVTETMPGQSDSAHVIPEYPANSHATVAREIDPDDDIDSDVEFQLLEGHEEPSAIGAGNVENRDEVEPRVTPQTSFDFMYI